MYLLVFPALYPVHVWNSFQQIVENKPRILKVLRVVKTHGITLHLLSLTQQHTHYTSWCLMLWFYDILILDIVIFDVRILWFLVLWYIGICYHGIWCYYIMIRLSGIRFCTWRSFKNAFLAEQAAEKQKNEFFFGIFWQILQNFQKSAKFWQKFAEFFAEFYRNA